MTRTKQNRTEFQVLGMREMLGEPVLCDAEARELCARAQNGDTVAQDRLCASFSKLAMMLSTAFAGLGKFPALDVEDLFSTAMMDGIRFGIQRYDPCGAVSFQNWVALCMRMRLTKAVYKERRYVQRMSENLDAITERWYTDPSRLEDLEHEEELQDLRHMASVAAEIGALTKAEHLAVEMRSRGCLYKAIAEAIGCHRNAITRHIRQGVQVLKAMVEAEL